MLLPSYIDLAIGVLVVLAMGTGGTRHALAAAIAVTSAGESTWAVVGAACGLACVLLIRGVKLAPLTLYGRRLILLATLFVGWAYISWAANGAPHESIDAWLLPMSVRLILIYSIMRLQDRKEVARAVIVGLLVGFSLQAVIGLAQSTGHLVVVNSLAYFSPGVSESRITGTGIDPNYFALDLAMTCSFALAYYRGAKHVAAIIVLILCGAAIVLSLSRTGAIALFVGVAAWILFGFRRNVVGTRGRRAAVPLIILLVALGSAGPSTVLQRFGQIGGTTEFSTAQQRVILWHAARQVIARHPATGVGPDQVRYAMIALDGPAIPRDASGMPLSAHDTPLDVGADLGIPGLVLWLSLLGVTLRAANVRRKSLDDLDATIGVGVMAAVSAYMVGSLFVTADLSFALWLSVALAGCTWATPNDLCTSVSPAMLDGRSKRIAIVPG